MRILVTDGMDKTALAQLKANGHDVVEQFYEPDALGAALKEFDVCVVRSATKVRAQHIDQAKEGRVTPPGPAAIPLRNWPSPICSPAPGLCPLPATPCAKASGKRKPMARALRSAARPWA